jgi:hypothetical protein
MARSESVQNNPGPQTLKYLIILGLRLRFLLFCCYVTSLRLFIDVMYILFLEKTYFLSASLKATVKKSRIRICIHKSVDPDPYQNVTDPQQSLHR